jgi:hypothetical protein
MDKTTQYRRLIKNLLIQHAKIVTHQASDAVARKGPCPPVTSQEL